MSKEVVSLERMERALNYLSETDDECAKLRSDWARFEWLAKSVKDTVFSGLTDGSVADRQAIANISVEHRGAQNKAFDAFYKYEAMKNRRATESIVIDTWRSLNSARNKGQIL